MKKFKMIFAILGLSLLVAFSYAFQLEGFNYNTDADASTAWKAIGNDISDNGATLTVTRETAIKQEGTSALKIVYAYSGNAWYVAGIHKTISPTWNMGNAKKFKIWTYNTETTVSSNNLMWYLLLWTNSGAVLEYDNYQSFSDLGWHESTFDLANFSEDLWTDQGAWTSPNMSAVTAVQILIQQAGASAGTTTLYLDDIRYWNTTNMSAENYQSFNYASLAALTTDWVVGASSGGTLAISQSTISFTNTKSMDMYYQITTYYANIPCTHTIPVTDFSGMNYFKVWLRGDSAANSAANPLLMLTLKDTTGSEAWAKVNMATLSNNTWQELFMPIIVGSADGGPFWENAWDGAGNIDLTAINRIIINAQTGTDAITAAFHTYIDGISIGYAADLSLVVNPINVTTRPSSSAVTLNIVKGVAPYTWALSTTALGTLSATSGTSVNYTPGSTIVSGNIIVTDADGQVINVPVAVTPTAAPLAGDTMTYNVIRKDISTNWNLLE
jgi:hypothetical protein